VPFEALLIRLIGIWSNERPSCIRWSGFTARLHSETSIFKRLSALVWAARVVGDGWTRSSSRCCAEADTVAAAFTWHSCSKGEKPPSAQSEANSPSGSFPLCRTSLAAPKGRVCCCKRRRTREAPRLIDANMVRQLTCKICSWRCSPLAALHPQRRLQRIRQRYRCTSACGCAHVVASDGPWTPPNRGFVQDFYSSVLSGQTVSDAIRLTSGTCWPTRAHLIPTTGRRSRRTEDVKPDSYVLSP